jgi:hypothetical protein
MEHLSLSRGSVGETWRGNLFSGDFERYIKRAPEMEHLSLCRGSVRGTWKGGCFLGTLMNMSGKALKSEHPPLIEVLCGEPERRAPILTTPRDVYQMALEMEHFFLQRLHKGNLKVFGKGGLSQYVYWARTCS